MMTNVLVIEKHKKLRIRTQIKIQNIPYSFELIIYSSIYRNSFVRNRMIKNQLMGVKRHFVDAKCLKPQFVLLIAAMLSTP
jgi:hypothetical protein